ncbi:MAG: 4'-phosphopantetheinyl transferase family protein, partial [Bacteroidales bacterium]
SYEYLEARPSSEIDIYYGFLSDTGQSLPLLNGLLSGDEAMRVKQLRNSNDKQVYALSHALLRLLIARKLEIGPGSISFIKDRNGRPYMPEGVLNFNISHTRYAFAITIVKNYFPGIDIERSDRNIDYEQVAVNYFSKREIDYISGSESPEEAFYRLWTRKESLLKSIGSGIVTDLAQVEVSDKSNIIPSHLFPLEKFKPLYEKYYIYSMKLADHHLSITIPEKRDLEIRRFTGSEIRKLVGSGIMETVK